MRDPKERIQDMLEAIERIERYTLRGKETFKQDELIQNWIVRHLQIIGEAARAMSQNVHELAKCLVKSNWTLILLGYIQIASSGTLDNAMRRKN